MMPKTSAVSVTASAASGEYRVNKYPAPPNHVRNALSVLRLNGETYWRCVLARASRRAIPLGR